MRIFKSIRASKVSFLLLFVFLTAVILRSPYDFGTKPHKIAVIINSISTACCQSDNVPRFKYNFPGLALNSNLFYAGSLGSFYLHYYADFKNPKESHLPTGSNRSPPKV